MEQVNIEINQERILDVEWCFQFGDEEPISFAYTKPEHIGKLEQTVELSISNVKNGNIVFTSSKDNKTFKIFPRVITEETKKKRDIQYGLSD